MPRWKNVLQTSDEVYRVKRNAVLREATRIIARKGFHNTSLDDVAEALQVSKGTLYNYVTDKLEILFECHMMSLDMGLQAAAFAEKHGTTGYAKLRLNLRAYIRWQNQALGAGGVTSDVTALRPADRRKVIARRDEIEDRLVSFIEEGIEDGTIRRVDPKLAVFTFMGAVTNVQSWYSPKGRLGLDKIADGMVDLLMHGLGTSANPDDIDLIQIPAEVPHDVFGAETAKQAADASIALAASKSADMGSPEKARRRRVQQTGEPRPGTTAKKSRP
ncbi:AcrR family transcriptional regulator [Bradyrhizobium algeriense]|uniref:AcrR family transcriptional regulator n=1 Tax=Bradyrhizobium algeriense TaxID=634784 RepID=A0ABU8BGD7_9BRAD